ncbi:MAG TPA: hypothetical protein VNN80_29885 [Polyangiaceae bacterium]|nr:hypothetical protein [Polyangiaceae bacterium]
MKSHYSSSRIPFSGARARAALLSIGGVALASSIAACQTQPDRNLGHAVGDRALDLTPPATPAATEPFGVPGTEFVGRWVGTAEEPLALGGERGTYSFPSGSQLFALDISLDEGSLVGSITFGNGAPPPPLDPERGHPSDVDYSQLGYFTRNAVGAQYYGPLPPYEGYPYVAYELFDDVAFDEAGNRLLPDGVLQIGFDTTEFLYPWCELQEPRESGGFFDCVGGGALADDEGNCFITQDVSEEQAAAGIVDHEPTDCNRLFLCSTARCQCTEDGCLYNSSGANASFGELTVRREGDTLTGLFSNTVFSNERQLPVPLGTVRLERVID